MATTRRFNQTMTHTSQGRLVQARRVADNQREDLLRSVMRDQGIISNQESDNKVVAKRQGRLFAAEQQERALVDSINQETTRRTRAAALGKTQEAAAVMLQREHDATVRDQKLRQQLVETEPEIRALKAQLEAGYTRKMQDVQITEHQQAAATRRQETEQTKGLQQTQRDEWVQEDIAKTRQAHTLKTMYQEELNEQLAEQEDGKRREFEQFMKDKQMIDDIVAQIHQEDAQERQTAVDQKLETQRDIQHHMTIKAQFERDLAMKMAEEEARLKEQAAEVEARLAAQKRRKANEMAYQEAMQAEMGAKQLAVASEKAENEELLRVLYEEERELELMQREESDMNKMTHRKMEMKKDYDTATYLKMKQREADMEEECAFRQAMLEKFARDDKLEQLSNDKRRRLGIQHGRDVERLIEERRERIMHEREQAARAHAQQQMLEKRRREIIEEERQKLIKAHAMKLLGYIPKGVIQPHDLEHLEPEVRESFRPQYTN